MDLSRWITENESLVYLVRDSDSLREHVWYRRCHPYHNSGSPVAPVRGRSFEHHFALGGTPFLLTIHFSGSGRLDKKASAGTLLVTALAT